MKLRAALSLVLVASVLAATAVVSQNFITTYFSRQRVRLCLRPEFVAESPGETLLSCAGLCLSRGFRCRGFRLKEAFVCRLFEFDKCDHMLNEANCTHFDWAFVRAQKGLPQGQLCADGFGNGYLGSTYKLVNISSWTDGLNKCSSEPGELTKYADGNDRAEVVTHFNSIKTVLNDSQEGFRSFFVGGTFTSGNWIWYSCGAVFLPEVWSLAYPYNFDPMNPNAYNRSFVFFYDNDGLVDQNETEWFIFRALCECVNPFY